MKVEKENLIIRSANVNDAQILTDWWNDGEVMAHAGCIIEIDQEPVGEMSFGIGKIN